MFDVLYLHKKSDWNCNELKFSLRSVEKYLDYNNVYVVGHKPDWLTGVQHIPHEPHQRRYVDVIKRLKKGVSAVQSDQAVLMHDDIFLLEPYQPILRHNGTLKDRMKRTAGDRKTMFLNTIEAIEGLTNYCLHYPLPFVKQGMVDAMMGMELLGKDMYTYMSLYGSLDNTFPKQESEDCKFKIPNMKQLEGLPCFSTHSESDDLLPVMLKLYPNKSIFEK